MKTTYWNILLVSMVFGLVMTSPASRYVKGRHSITRRSLNEDECVYQCGKDVYYCDLRCTYIKHYLKKGLTTGDCMSKCGDRYIMCYVDCSGL